ncbi:Uncharacterised protein [Mycobacteroides abscessus]|nr:Uncharacterised protein [Mycobacteroides abscessus]CQA12656.1 Uncharacterised protein [Mycobacteroides abscessus]
MPGRQRVVELSCAATCLFGRARGEEPPDALCAALFDAGDLRDLLRHELEEVSHDLAQPGVKIGQTICDTGDIAP